MAVILAVVVSYWDEGGVRGVEGEQRFGRWMTNDTKYLTQSKTMKIKIRIPTHVKL